MEVRIAQGPDQSDPFNQLTLIVARETIGGKSYQVGQKFTSDFFRSVRGEMMAEIITSMEKRMGLEFARILEASIHDEILKSIGMSSIAASMPDSWLKKNIQKDEVMLLPKDILIELEPLEEKRILENLGVTV